MQLLLERYTEVIGGGGYGVVKTGTEPPYNEEAVKFLYKGDCPSAKKEYILARQVYDAYKVYKKCSAKDSVAGVVKPIDFVQEIPNKEASYSCALIMQRVFFPTDYAIHPALNAVVPQRELNKLLLSGKGQPRGYYLDPVETSAYMPLETVTYAIGLLDAIAIFGAKLIPIDAEYVITRENRIFMLDFGMFKELTVSEMNVQEVAEEISRAQEYNLYYHPYSDAVPESCKHSFLLGFSEGYVCFSNGNKVYEQLYEALLSLYNEVFTL